VVDDGSCPPAAIPEDPRIRLIRHDVQRGVSAARNSGVAVARGEWVAFCDDDDVWAPGKLAAQLAAAGASGAGWAYVGNVTVDDNLHVLGGGPAISPREVVQDLGRYNTVPGSASSVLANRAVLASAGGFDIRLRHAEDWDMWLRVARHGLPARVNRPLVGLRQHARNASREVEPLLHEVSFVGRRYGLRVDLPRHLRWAAWLRLEDGQRIAAINCYLQAAAHGDVRSLARAVVAGVDRGVVQRRRRVDRAWANQAEPWLECLRAAC